MQTAVNMTSMATTGLLAISDSAGHTHTGNGVGQPDATMADAVQTFWRMRGVRISTSGSTGEMPGSHLHTGFVRIKRFGR